MAEVGQVVTIPTGAYRNVTLDSGETIIVNHEQPGGRGSAVGARLTVDRLERMGFSSETVVTIALDTAEGHVVLTELMKTEALGAPGSPLRAFLADVHGCKSVAEVIARCRQLQRAVTSP